MRQGQLLRFARNRSPLFSLRRRHVQSLINGFERWWGMKTAAHSHCPGTTFALGVHLPSGKNVPHSDRLARLEGAHQHVLCAQSARCHAVVILPDRIEAVWTLPPTEMAHPARLRAIKRAFAALLDVPPATGAWWRRGPRLRATPITRPSDMARHRDGYHFAPVRHGWTRRPQDWPLSTVHRAAPSEMILT